VASELIRQLLSRGYAVKATVRCAADSPRLQYLRDIADKGEGTLQLVQVTDIQHPSEALDSALEGVTYVFHVASPFRFDGEWQLQPNSSEQNPCSRKVVIVKTIVSFVESLNSC
jgi:nucleoside-diphosphate-sugar epimerase